MKRYNVVLENRDSFKRINRTIVGNGIGDIKTKVKSKLNQAKQHDKWRIVSWTELGGDENV